MRFIADRMLGTLTRYLRFMGYDTLSANSLKAGDTREDTALLGIARAEGRILLTRDRELARRGGELAVFVEGDDVMAQIRTLCSLGLISPVVVMDRCSLCNTELRPATDAEVEVTEYAPEERDSIEFFLCPTCHRLYWMGSHGRNLVTSLRKNLESPPPERDCQGSSGQHPGG
ncbi:MAG: Mut7-C RNAse domain-containing protein [Methanomicrobiales archaeon]|nr:Mut7-C RNAse domain-containing protein [Methanomicrobiales archaeon]